MTQQNRRFLSVCTGILLIVVVTSLSQANEEQRRPNIVYIMADDLGIGDVSCFGKDRCLIETPNIDALASQGMMFTDAHAPASVCVPTRVAIMSGRYAWRFERPRPDGAWGFLNPRMATDQFTVGRMLQSAGYHTGYVGKWHLGTLMPTRDGQNQGLKNVDYSRPLKIGPPQYGFDDSFILPGSLDMYPYVFVRNNRFLGKVTAQKGWSAFNRVGPAAEDFEDYKVLDTFSREAELFIERNAKQSLAGKPFFLYVALTAPHTPTSPSPTFEGKSQLGLYGDFVMETDDCVGRVVAALKKNGLDQNTLVIFTSDHGPAAYAGNIRKATPGQIRDLERKGHYSRGVFRGYKFSAYEGGLRVPFVVRWPGVVKPNSECDRLIGLNDLMRTLADVSGQHLKDTVAPDSISYLPLLKNPQAPAPRTSMILQSTRSFVVRQGDWKLAICPGSGCPGTLGNRPTQQDAWKQAIAIFGRSPKNRDEVKQFPFVQLFRLDKDPRENTNLAAANSDRIAVMLALLEQQISNGRSTAGPKLGNDKKSVNYLSGIPAFVWKKRK